MDAVVAAAAEAAGVDMVDGWVPGTTDTVCGCCWPRRENVVVVGLAAGVPNENAVVVGPVKLKLNGVVVIFL